VSTFANQGPHQLPGPSGIVMAGSALAFAGAAVILGWSFLHWEDSSRPLVTGPGEVLGCALATAGVLALIFVLPGVLRGFTPWAINAAVAGLGFVLVDAWYNGTIAVGVAREIDDATYDTIYQSGWALAFSLPKMLLCFVGGLGLAVSGWRSGRVSRAVAVLLAVGGLASLIPPFMPGILVTAIAYFLVAWPGRRSAEAGRVRPETGSKTTSLSAGR
jgi:hypothetical protein